MATQAEIGEHLDLSVRRVHQLIKEGIIPGSKGRGNYDLDASRLAYISYLRGLANKQVDEPETPPGFEGDDDDEGFIDAEREEARRKKYDADLKKERLKILRRENAPVTIITDVIGRQMEMVSAQLRALPMQIKLAEPSLTSRSTDRIQKTITDLCNELVNAQPDLDDFIDDPDMDDDAQEGAAGNPAID